MTTERRTDSVSIRLLTGLLVFVASIPAGLEAADRDQLRLYAETLNGKVLASRGADIPFNPASLVKVGTSLWALESLGREYRYRTVFGVTGAWDRETGRLVGSLVVQGLGDPDFQAENLFMVARRLNELGLNRVEGLVRIDGDFWMGWENGAAQAVMEPSERVELMGRRLRTALDPRRWDHTTIAAWTAACDRRGWDPADPPRVEVVGSVQPGAPEEWEPVVAHLSNPLSVMLKRFNVYSNNDIIRIAEGLGGVSDLEDFLEKRLGRPTALIELSTASGEERNRMTARTGVRLLRAFLETVAGMGLAPSEILPAIGCEPGSTDRKFPRLAVTDRAGSVVVKTGTLTNTDGGVAVVGGFFTSVEREQVLFCAAAQKTGWNESRWRSMQQSWMLELIDQVGGAVQRPCGPELPFSDTYALVE